MSSFKNWIDAARPRTLPLSLAGILLGSSIAFLQGSIDWLIFSFAMLTTIAFQILSNFANDYGDGVKGTDNESRVGPMRSIQSGAISSKQMLNAIVLTSFISLLSAGSLIYISSTGFTLNLIIMYSVLALLAIIAAITYTVGKKAYGYNGMGDLMVFIFFGLLSVLGVYSLYTKEFTWFNIFPAIAIGLLSTAVLNLNNMRDYKGDTEANKRTLVVMMGINNAKRYHGFLILAGIFSYTYFLFELNQPILFISCLPFLILTQHLRTVMQAKDVAEFDPELKKVALSTFGIALLFFICIWFV